MSLPFLFIERIVLRFGLLSHGLLQQNPNLKILNLQNHYKFTMHVHGEFVIVLENEKIGVEGDKI